MPNDQVIIGGSLSLSRLELTPVGPNALIDIYYIDIDIRVVSIEEAIEDINSLPGIQINKENLS